MDNGKFLKWRERERRESERGIDARKGGNKMLQM
jgi:hypothetical protein